MAKQRTLEGIPEPVGNELLEEVAIEKAVVTVKRFCNSTGVSVSNVSGALRAVPEHLLELVAMATRQPLARLQRLRGLGDQVGPG